MKYHLFVRFHTPYELFVTINISVYWSNYLVRIHHPILTLPVATNASVWERAAAELQGQDARARTRACVCVRARTYGLRVEQLKISSRW
jgi:hypothetical protein